MRYDAIVEALTDAGMPEAVEVLRRLREEDLATRVKHRTPRERRRTNPVTDEIKEEVFRLHANTGLTQTEIAARLNIWQGDVSNILRGRI